MDFELQRAQGVRDALDVITQTVGEIVEWVDTPFCTCVVMIHMTNPIKQRVTQPYIG